MFADLEKRLKTQYQIRVTRGGTLCGRPQGYTLGQPFRAIPLARCIRTFLDHRDFGGAGTDRSGLFYSGIEEDFKAYILAGDLRLLDERAGERFTTSPGETTKCLIKE